MDEDQAPPPTFTINDDGTLMFTGIAKGPPVESDPPVGSAVALSDVLKNVTFHGIVGPPGPPGPPGLGAWAGHNGSILAYDEHDNLLRSAVQPEPEISFVVDGYVFSFPTREHARKVQEKLNGMTLEGEL